MKMRKEQEKPFKLLCLVNLSSELFLSCLIRTASTSQCTLNYRCHFWLISRVLWQNNFNIHDQSITEDQEGGRINKSLDMNLVNQNQQAKKKKCSKKGVRKASISTLKNNNDSKMNLIAIHNGESFARCLKALLPWAAIGWGKQRKVKTGSMVPS